MRLKQLFILSSIMLCAATVKAEGKGYAVSGVVADDKGNPIQGITVLVGNASVLTDADGRWEKTNVQGQVRIRAYDEWAPNGFRAFIKEKPYEGYLIDLEPDSETLVAEILVDAPSELRFVGYEAFKHIYLRHRGLGGHVASGVSYEYDQEVSYRQNGASIKMAVGPEKARYARTDLYDSWHDDKKSRSKDMAGKKYRMVVLVKGENVSNYRVQLEPFVSSDVVNGTFDWRYVTLESPVIPDRPRFWLRSTLWAGMGTVWAEEVWFIEQHHEVATKEREE
jgi:hypothetical protein